MIAVEMTERTIDLGKFTQNPERGRIGLPLTAEFLRDQQIDEAALLQKPNLFAGSAAELVAFDSIVSKDLREVGSG